MSIKETFDFYKKEEDFNNSIEWLIDNNRFRKIQKEDLNLKEGENLKLKIGLLDKIFKGLTFKNIIQYRKMFCESIIDISDTEGKHNIKLLQRKSLKEKLQKIRPEERSKIKYVHIGAIQILIKSIFGEGINSPITVALIDSRIQDLRDSVITMVEGNLAYTKLIFITYPNIGIPLETENLDLSLNF